jgi:hypothetical protein
MHGSLDGLPVLLCLWVPPLLRQSGRHVEKSMSVIIVADSSLTYVHAVY